MSTFKLVYRVDENRKVYLQFFAEGYPYRLLGLFPTNRHLLGFDSSKPENGLFLLGTDLQGRDVWSRLMVATRVSLTIGLAGVTISLFLGVLLGGISGLYGGMIDTAIQRMIEIVRSIPTIPLWMGLAAALPNTWSSLQVYFAITVIISLIGWTDLARVVRGRFLSLREEDFVMAAELMGASRMRIIFRHMLPSFLSHVIAAVSLALPAMIISETSLELPGPRPAAAGDQLGHSSAGRAEHPDAGHRALAAWWRPFRSSSSSWPSTSWATACAMRPIPMADTTMSLPGAPILSIRNLEVQFAQDEGLVRAVDGASFDLHPGKTLGIVGESGCGKSVTARAVLQIVDHPGRIVGGEIWFDRPGLARLDIAQLDPRSPEMREIRGKEIALIFQEPMTSFSAHYTVGNQISEAIRCTRQARARREHASARSSCCAWSASRDPSGASTNTRSSYQAACGSAS